MNAAHASEPPPLETARLRLRGVRQADQDALFDIYSDLKTLEYWGRDPVPDSEAAWVMIENNLKYVAAGEALLWGIEFRETGTLIGTCTLFKINWQNRNSEVGYILNREYWRKGIMSEALSLVLDHAFLQMNLHRLEADVDPANRASLALLEKKGFQREGTFRERWYVHEEWHDSVMLGLLRSDYL